MSTRIVAVHENIESRRINHVIFEDGRAQPIQPIIEAIKAGKEFHTEENGKTVQLYVGHNEQREFLTTDPDNYKDNNLSELPRK